MIESAPHQAIYRRWRAQTFGQIVGQEAVVETLRNAVRTGRVSHAILFVGPRGTGKTSLARIVAKAVNCTNLQDGDPCDTCPSCVSIREGRAMDLIEIDAASNRGIDAIRELRDRINYAPTDLRRKVYILDEAHQITRDAWNALLKSLEEPPEFVVFMFASTHPQEFPPAILSRLQRFDVRRLTTTEIEGKLARILEADSRAATPEALHLIARLAAGGMRDAESMLDQLLATSSETLDEGQVRELLGLADGETISAFVDALAAGDVVAGITLLDGLEERGRDLRGFLDQVVESLRETIVGAGREPALARHPIAALVAVARRLAAIDPSRAGVGGLRLQLEVALFPDAVSSSRGALASSVPAPAANAEVLAPRSAATRQAAPPEQAPTAPTAPKGARSQPPTDPPAASDPQTDQPPADVAAEPQASARRATPKPAAPPPDPVAAPETTSATKTPAAEAPAAAPEAAPAAAQAAPAAPEAGHAPSAAPSTAATETLQVPSVAGDLAVLRDRWPEVVERISAHPPTKPLIAKCRPVSVEGNVVTLGFPEDQGFLAALVEKRRPILEDGIGAILGHPVTVHCIATNLDLVPEVAMDESELLLREAQRIFGGDAAEVADVG